MIFLLLGCVSLLVLMAALGMFSRAQVADIKQFGVWVAAIGGLLLATMLFLVGRGGIAIAALMMLGPLVWSWIGVGAPSGKLGVNPGAGKPGNGGRTNGTMRRDEALEVLGLQSSATKADIQAAYVRLMRTAHPDRGGSDWLAARINQARDVLLG